MIQLQSEPRSRIKLFKTFSVYFIVLCPEMASNDTVTGLNWIPGTDKMDTYRTPARFPVFEWVLYKTHTLLQTKDKIHETGGKTGSYHVSFYSMDSIELLILQNSDMQDGTIMTVSLSVASLFLSFSLALAPSHSFAVFRSFSLTLRSTNDQASRSHMCVHINVYTHKYILTYVRTYIHTYIDNCKCLYRIRGLLRFLFIQMCTHVHTLCS